MDGEQKAEVELLNLFRKTTNAPLKLYDKVFKWAHRATQHHKVNFSEPANSRRLTLKNLSTKYDLDGVRPTKQHIQLPSGVEVELVTHNFLQQCYSLLTCPLASKPENLADWGDFPFSPLPENPQQIRHAMNGSVYHTSYEKYVNVPGVNVLWLIKIYIDKTHTDLNGKLCVEQVRLLC